MIKYSDMITSLTVKLRKPQKTYPAYLSIWVACGQAVNSSQQDAGFSPHGKIRWVMERFAVSLALSLLELLQTSCKLMLLKPSYFSMGKETLMLKWSIIIVMVCTQARFWVPCWSSISDSPANCQTTHLFLLQDTDSLAALGLTVFFP